MNIEAEAARVLLSGEAVRTRCRMILDAGLAGRLAHFAIDAGRLNPCADFVAETVRLNYPTLAVPFHSRWRHFVLDDIDLYAAAVDRGLFSREPHVNARQRFELAITSVLLDAGAGPKWQWTQPVKGQSTRGIGRSEGLALASLSAFTSGLFSCDPSDPARADAEGLSRLTVPALGDAFQVSADNPLEGLEGRVGLFNRLGQTIAARPDLFGSDGRLGGLYDALTKFPQPPSLDRDRGRSPAPSKLGAVGSSNPISAPLILALLLEALGPIWPDRITVGGVRLGDTWRHPVIAVPGPTFALVPFHKLSQWLAYSLIEPIQEAGYSVTDIDGLTGLAEYRNGGLLVDMEVIVPKDRTILTTAWSPADEVIVEWRALTVALLDELAPLVRAKLGVTCTQMSLASVLEGGTWSAGRRIARRLRPDGGPPISIVSDGSVF